MVAIVSGNSLGLVSTSLGVTGQSGGVANTGRGGDLAFVNAATGNLVVQRQDELLMALGSDIGVLRTYNSQGLLDDDNGDNWRIGFYREIRNLTGSVNTAGSTIVRVDADGAESLYRYDSGKAQYVNKDGVGSFDLLRYDAATSTWTWTDGDTQTTERYDWNLGRGKLLGQTDSNGQSLTFSYSANLLSQVVNASGEATYLDYSGNNLSQIRTVRADGTSSVRVRYGYDSSNRLTQVTVDLTPDDNSVVDGKVYTTLYSYDGTSRRIASITETDGTQVNFTYTLLDGKYRVTQVAQDVGGVPQVTRYDYTDSAGSVGVTVNANSTALTSTQATSPYYAVPAGASWESVVGAVYGVMGVGAVEAGAALQAELGNPALTAGVQLTVPANLNYQVQRTVNDAALSDIPQTTSLPNGLINTVLTQPGWGAAVLNESLSTAASAPQVVYAASGNGLAVWVQGSDLYTSSYNKTTESWSAPSALDGSLTGTPSKPHLSVSDNGNLLVTWLQNNNVYARRNIAGVWDGSASAIPLLENLAGAAVNPVGAINDAGRAVVIFPQTDGTRYNLYANIYNGTAWQTSASNIDDLGTANNNALTTTMVPSVALDNLGNVGVVWLQKAGAQTTDSLHTSRFDVATSLWSTPPSSTLLENTTTAVTQSKIVFDGNGNGLVLWLQGTSLFARTYTRAGNTWGAATTLSTTASGVPTVSISSNGNAIAAWTETGSIYARRFSAGAWVGSAKELLETGTGTARNPSAAINDNGQAVVSFTQVDGTLNNVYANRFSGGAWAGASLLESNANTVGTAVTDTPSVAIDAQGNVQTLWLQKNAAETVNSLFGSRFNAASGAYYLVPAGATWASVALALYGTVDAASALQTLLGNPALTVGSQLSGLPATLDYNITTTVPAYYSVPADATWASVALALYGTEDVADELQALLGNPALTEGAQLTGLPATLNDEVHFTVRGLVIQSGDTWESIAQAVYGTATVASQLQTALGNPPLTAGTTLINLPASFIQSAQADLILRPYFYVTTGATWASIAQTVYGSSDEALVLALQNATGSPVLAQGLLLTIPTSLTYQNFGFTLTVDAQAGMVSNL
ncbi:MAG: hypothetical protein RIS44_3237, partial [Pseudomonadota bacterium]